MLLLGHCPLDEVSGDRGTDTEFSDPAATFKASREPAHFNSNGRPKLMKAVHVTADRVQHDMLRNKSRGDQKDEALHEKRRFVSSYSAVPSRDTVSDYHRLSEVPIARDPTMQVLTEHARRKLHNWQVRGPEQSRECAAQVMRSLRSLTKAIERLPTYAEHSAHQQTSCGDACTASLHDYSKVVPKGHRLFKAATVPLQHSRSSPAVVQPLPLIDPEELDALNRPGGYLVNHADSAPLQMLKNKDRAVKSKIPIAGGRRDWSTSAQVVGFAQVF
mmetsp:Transcript_75486/g.233524  ORF Transcript_75486/g.233524 Transcript_75486/m.233524 type:complete len:274 (+) Transcript_75486:200-1021(+)